MHPQRILGGAGRQWRMVRNRFSGSLRSRRGDLISEVSDMWYVNLTRGETSYAMTIQRNTKVIAIPKMLIGEVMPEVKMRIHVTDGAVGTVWEIQNVAEDADFLKWRCQVTEMKVND